MHASLLWRRIAPSRAYLRSFASQATTPGLQSLLERRPEDVVVVFAKRTAMGKAKKGQFKDTPVDEILSGLLKATFEATKLDPGLVDDIAVGTCHPPSPLYVSRSAALSAGIPNHVPIQAINRLCASGLMAIRSIANDIRAGETSLGIAMGAESMSLNPRPTPELSKAVEQNPQAHDCVQPMGWTSEMVAETYNISREKQDHYALISHTRASQAFQSGLFAEEILPIRIGDIVVSEDDTVRPGVTAESLANLKPVFSGWGRALTTAGNASGVGDGAAIAILTTRSRAEKEGWDVVAKWGGCSVAGVEPRLMGIGPVVAIPKVLAHTGLNQEDIDVWEINEAFASQFAYCIETLNIPMDKVNPSGGSIALSHPLGMTGVRLAVTGLAELKRRDAKVLCTSMCVGSGMGAAAIFVNEARP
ncbi:Thiolase, N-terminal domain-containing protein [Gautieria morchelliformis]|nr:Thiolase, N-terminal domain-containing protein [Gautieria morchelliformis]